MTRVMVSASNTATTATATMCVVIRRLGGIRARVNPRPHKRRPRPRQGAREELGLGRPLKLTDHQDLKCRLVN